MEHFFQPPVAFALMLGLVWLHSLGFGALARRLNPAKPQSAARLSAYACGEPVTDHKSQPDYSQFFPFAWFFTIMHVVALIVATMPRGSPTAAWFAVAFVACAAASVHVLLRR